MAFITDLVSHALLLVDGEGAQSWEEPGSQVARGVVGVGRCEGSQGSTAGRGEGILEASQKRRH